MKNNPFSQPISEQIWNMKYRLVTPNPEIQNDESVYDTWHRIAHACAQADIQTYGYGRDLPKEEWERIATNREQIFYEALENFRFLPAGRITAGAGSARSVTLFNCFVMGTIPDSLIGIFDMLKEAALTMQQGGGIGYDFSTIRPKGSRVKGVDADASGPISFMNVWDAMCRTIMSAGSRRGAMMATMSCSHPDVVEFITAKQDPALLRMFNVSVLCTDDFMDAVKHDRLWPLVHDKEPTDTSLGQDDNGMWIYEWVQAKDLWDLMMNSTFKYAEPGVLFIDRINKMNNLEYMETIAATNPCGEQPLPPYGACLLGSLNLPTFVLDPFLTSCDIDFDKLEGTVQAAVSMLDSVIDISNFPIPEQKAEAKQKRRMGIGITGLADMLFMLNTRYGSKDAVALTNLVMRSITLTAYRQSIRLAKDFGPCPATDTIEKRKAFLNSGFMKQANMPEDIIEGIMEHGIRNALLISIAPTGTISLYAGNVSSGIEPIFAPSYNRKVTQADGSKTTEKVWDYAVGLYKDHCENTGIEFNIDDLDTAQTLTPNDHLVMQAAVQKWVDSSISKTINLPEDISFENFEKVYLDAYDMGCKGCTTYRPNEITGSVISIEEKPKEEPTPETPQTVEPVSTHKPVPRDAILDGQTYKLKWEGTNFYITINNFTENGKTTPFEIFINTQDMKHFQWTQALTRMMSSVFRRGGDISFVVEDLKAIIDPNGGVWLEGKYVPSFIALLGRTLETHLKFLNQGTKPVTVVEIAPPLTGEMIAKTNKKALQCTSCKGFNVNIQQGCPVCGDCGHSKCG